MWENIDKNYVIVCQFMDDMLILSNNDYMIKYTKKILINKFYMVILRIKITRTFDGLCCPNLILLIRFLINFLKVTIA
jgi:hypothetical protein